jgi:hypothetical protein
MTTDIPWSKSVGKSGSASTRSIPRGLFVCFLGLAHEPIHLIEIDHRNYQTETAKRFGQREPGGTLAAPYRAGDDDEKRIT